ncbi:Crp/Fnr family transcriptional regulator [Bradyrhizobium sp. CCBAU 53338]|uniref:Crp/Fnr family transcriptional regulator n=1 Tax=Bradyrhizobium sp. CCBAU 53338 TaxID=1325111 RepID=UPI00188AAD91|nr:Crp/Fnr family transcriptional regulator [Bradyrhizobium sp. CCBAU 53338]
MVEEVRNKLLRLIPAEELAGIVGVCERIQLRRHQVLHHYRLPMEYVYFVESGLVSVAARVDQDKFVEVWLIGSEGLVGAPVLLAAKSAPLHRRTVQVDGEALRVKTSDFSKILENLPYLRSVVERYLAAVLVQTSQSGACNSYHDLRQRLVRWLLVARSSLGTDNMPLTHMMLAELLGVRRASVTECLEGLQKEGTLSTRRGCITVEDAVGLSKLSCDCFSLIEYEYRRHLLLADHASHRETGATITSTSAPILPTTSARAPSRTSG